jgi:hypothetical protein
LLRADKNRARDRKARLLLWFSVVLKLRMNRVTGFGEAAQKNLYFGSALKFTISNKKSAPAGAGGLERLNTVR